jgi:uncharacterized membrane protein YfcA
MQAVLLRFLDNAQTPGGISGSLALIIALTLCIVYYQHPNDNTEIRQALIYALTSIIGFYFGTTASKPAPAPGNQNVVNPVVPKGA